jgi:serine/threonine protein kinase
MKTPDGVTALLPQDATTRTAGLARPSTRPSRYLSPAQIIVSPDTRLSYRVERLLGQGGYGQVYLVKRLGRSSAVPASLCLKVSPHKEAWLREAYFGQMLDDHPRAVRVFEAFPSVRPDGQFLYCLAHA